MRAEKIRTFNYPQNRVTDHRFNESWYDLSNIINGSLQEVLTAVHQHMGKNLTDKAVDTQDQEQNTQIED
jgi:protein subunit release factor A